MTEERQLLKATIAGDTAAFELIVRKYQNLICAITFGGTGRIEASEELAQETFFNAWRNISKLKDLERFRPWLCSIARNLVRNYHRERKPEVSLADNHTDIVDSDNNPSENAVSREETMILEQAFNRIPIEYREPLVLFYRQGHSVRQVAEGLELNEATVKTRLHRGRQMLKEQTAALVERTLERTVPDARFTKAVMVGIGAGLAAGVAGTASAAAAIGTTGASGSSVLSTVTGLLSTLAGKIAVATVAIIVTAGVAVYTYQNSQEDNSQQVIASEKYSQANIQPQTEMPNTKGQEPKFVEPVHQEDEANLEAVPQDTEAASIVETMKDVPPVRHPDWPGLHEPVKYIYMLTSGNQTWIQLPRKFREENEQTILIDNAKERIEVKKTDKTVQYSATMTNQDSPVYRYNQPLTSLEAVKFATLFGRSSIPHTGSGYTVHEIGQEGNGAVLVYSMQSKGLEDSDYEATAYVDAATQLPEKIVVVNIDPNSPMNGQILERLVFDFAPIADSIFEYDAKDDESVLPYKQKPCFRGQVVDMMGNPMAGADVFVFYFPLWGEKYLTGKSDVNGEFEIKIPQKTDEITIHMPIYYWATIKGNPGFTAWTILDRTEEHSRFSYMKIKELITGFGGTVVQSSDTIEMVEKTENGITTYYQNLSAFLRDPVVEDVRLVMEPAGVLTGYVTDMQGNVIPDAQIDAEFQVYGTEPGIFGFSSSEINWMFSSTTNSEGYYEFNGLPPLWKNCRYSLTVSAPGYVSEKKELKLEGALESQEFNISLEPQLVTIRGILTDNYGTALEKRRISLSVPNTVVQDCSTTTDPNGCFVLEGCPDVPGLEIRSALSWIYPPYDVTEEKGLYESFMYYPDVAQKIPYVSGQCEYFVELSAIRPEMKVEVLVTDSVENSLPDYKVKLDGRLIDIRHGDLISILWREQKLEKRTDMNGRIVFDNIPDLKEMKLVLSPNQSFTREMNALNGNFKEQQRLRKIDEAYRNKYQEMEIPVELVEGQTDYFVEVVVLTKEEAQSLPETP